MTTRDTFVTIADLDQLNEGYFNGIRDEFENNTSNYLPDITVVDQTPVELDNQAAITELLLMDATIPADSVKNGVLIICNGFSRANANAGGVSTGTITTRMRAGSSSTFGDNTLRVTKIHEVKNAAASNLTVKSSWTIVYRLTGLTWTNANYVHITMEASHFVAVANLYTGQCEGIQVIQL